jgi:hypothetical protein
MRVHPKRSMRKWLLCPPRRSPRPARPDEAGGWRELAVSPSISGSACVAPPHRASFCAKGLVRLVAGRFLVRLAESNERQPNDLSPRRQWQPVWESERPAISRGAHPGDGREGCGRDRQGDHRWRKARRCRMPSPVSQTSASPAEGDLDASRSAARPERRRSPGANC